MTTFEQMLFVVALRLPNLVSVETVTDCVFLVDWARCGVSPPLLKTWTLSPSGPSTEAVKQAIKTTLANKLELVSETIDNQTFELVRVRSMARLRALFGAKPDLDLMDRFLVSQVVSMASDSPSTFGRVVAATYPFIGISSPTEVDLLVEHEQYLKYKALKEHAAVPRLAFA